jgi:hypothetical protein
MSDITKDHSMTYHLFGEAYQVTLQKSTYKNGGTAIQLFDAVDGFPFATATTWMPDLAENEVAIKNYSENVGMLNFLMENGIVEAPHREIESGFTIVPVCKLK